MSRIAAPIHDPLSRRRRTPRIPLSVEAQALDTYVWRSGPDGFDITPSTSSEVIGRIWVKARGVIGGLWAKGGAAIIEPRSNSPLNGISAGPYASREAAMSAIGAYLQGACELKDPKAI